MAKNGTLLLNILQRPDGTIDEQADWILSELAKWFKVNGEAIYGTRPFRVSGEGSSSVKIEGFCEYQVEWKDDDFRFVQKDGNLYAFIMKAKDRKTTVIKSLNKDDVVSEVTLLGYGNIPFMQYSGVLVVDLPDDRDKEYPNALKIQFSPRV